MRGKGNVIKALTDNERAVVNTLLENSGGMRRNELERASGVSKSSLARAVANLEARGIIDVDRTRTVHFIRLSDWFSSL